MIRARVAAAFLALATTLAAAAPAPAPARSERLIYGLTQPQTGATLACAGESSLALGAYLLYETGKPIEETLPLVKLSEGGMAAPANAEARLRAVYEAKPRSVSEWGRRSFQNCLARNQVPLDANRTGNCYMLTFYLASVVPLYKANGYTPETMMDFILSRQADPAFRTKVAALVAEYYNRSTAEPRENQVLDLGRFLQCANPGKAPVSGNQ
jgi:hypothetical protein